MMGLGPSSTQPTPFKKVFDVKTNPNPIWQICLGETLFPCHDKLLFLLIDPMGSDWINKIESEAYIITQQINHMSSV